MNETKVIWKIAGFIYRILSGISHSVSLVIGLNNVELNQAKISSAARV